MFGNYVFTVSVLSLLVMGQAAPARAADSCQPVFDALQKLVTTPSHSYTTSTAAKGGSPRTAETIMVRGQKYIRVNGKWMDARVTTQEVMEQEKEKEKSGKSSCQLVRSESVKGESASLYHLQRETEDFKEDSQIWISTARGVPLREEQDIEMGASIGKRHNSAHFEYTNIHPPM
ncbi:MAG: hypothetical protein LAP86_23840 [Acidobacteriia bacterium]|nr:hypothetical protein [Terriglobia bacterium]